MVVDISSRDRGTFFYLAMAGSAVAAALAGFSTTYFLPMARGRFDGPSVAHIHGVLFFAWLALMLAQPVLIRWHRPKLHRKIGLIALPLALAMAASCVAIGFHSARRDFGTGGGDTAISTVLGPVMSMAIFLTYVALAITLRKRPDWHKRMMILATIAVLWPAFFRFRHFMPWVPNPDLVLAVIVPLALVPIAMLRDKLAFGRVHSAYLIFGSALVVEQTTEFLLFDTAPWRSIAKAVYSAIAYGLS